MRWIGILQFIGKPESFTHNLILVDGKTSSILEAKFLAGNKSGERNVKTFKRNTLVSHKFPNYKQRLVAWITRLPLEAMNG